MHRRLPGLSARHRPIRLSRPARVDIALIGALLLGMIALALAFGDGAVMAQTPTPTQTAKNTPTPEATALPLPPLTGTIIANRTDVSITFFLEGQTYTIAPQRSRAVTFARDTSVLNLFNCEAGTGADSADCFWDPYLLRKDGFYEIFDKAKTGDAASLILQDAMTPPGDQIWLHNRTGAEESIYYAGATYRLAPGTTTEVVLVSGDNQIYRRNCLELGDQSVCEWLPQQITGGVYYAMSSAETFGSTGDTRRVTVNLAPVLAKDTTILVSSNEPAIPSVGCSLNVRTLNVRAGPGVDYLVLAKLRETDLGEDLVGIRGRAAEGEWLAVDESIAAGGWISGNIRFVTCAGDVDALPVVEISDGRLSPTPAPQAAQPAPAPASQPEAEATAAPEQAQPQAPSGPPPGQVRLVVINAFGQPIRFTYQSTEYDMQPNDQVIIDTNPGLIAFSASSPWRNQSGNADFQMLADETRVLYVRWEQNPDNGSWDLKFD